MQGGRCLWSGRPLLEVRGAPVDHVIPWSRLRLSVLENFTMTTSAVNSSKSNLLLGPAMVERWISHLGTRGAELRALAVEHGWATDLNRALGATRAQYRSVPASIGVWDGPEAGVRPLGDAGRSTVLSLLDEIA